MKEHAKNAIKHDINVLGKSVPVVAIAALFLIGSGSAALLTSFGTVSGDAQVDQAITLNGNNIEDQSASWAISDVIAGEAVSGEPQTLNNNLDESVSINLDTSVTPASPSNDASTTDEAAYNAQYLLLENGEAFTNTEPNNQDEGPVDSDKASTSYIYTGDQTGVEATYSSDTGHVHSGLWFNVTPTAADQAVIEPDLAIDDANNDWIYAAVEYDEELYLTGKFNGATEYEIDSNTQFTYEVQDSEGNQLTDIGTIETREDFEKGSERDALSQAVGGESIPWGDVTVHYAVAGTGTQDGDGVSGSLTYTDFHFDDGNGKESLITRISPTETVQDFEASSGDHELGFAADFKVNAYPGDYTFDLSINP